MELIILILASNILQKLGLRQLCIFYVWEFESNWKLRTIISFSPSFSHLSCIDSTSGGYYSWWKYYWIGLNCDDMVGEGSSVFSIFWKRNDSDERKEEVIPSCNNGKLGWVFYGLLSDTFFTLPSSTVLDNTSGNVLGNTSAVEQGNEKVFWGLFWWHL